MNSGTVEAEILRCLQRIGSPERDVQIWIANLDLLDATDIEKLSVSLDSVELKRTGEFRFEQDRQHYRAVHGILRHLLGATLGISPLEIAFNHGLGGKPRLAENCGTDRVLHFNLSHSNGWAVFAFSWEREVGIDLESEHLLPKGEELYRLATRVLSKRELAEWLALTNDETRRAAFLSVWSRKEACVKASGDGLRRELAELQLLPDANESYHVFDEATRWMVHDLTAPAGFAAALAVGPASA